MKIVVGINNNGSIGLNNQMLWRSTDDFKHFKNLTSGGTVIMGRKTYESIGKPLPNRTNIVISRDLHLQIPGCFVVSSLELAIQRANIAFNDETDLEKQTFIIGGGEIYKQAIHLCDEIHISHINDDKIGDTFFEIPEDYKGTVFHYYFENKRLKMRQILYRGYSVHDKEWVYGFPLISRERPGRTAHFIIRDENEEYNDPYIFTLVHEKSIGQYIGIGDKNGTKIFEGDIIKFIDAYDTSTENGTDWEEYPNIGTVYFNDESCYLSYDVTNRASVDIEDLFDGSEEVIGNQYLDSDLLSKII